MAERKLGSGDSSIGAEIRIINGPLDPGDAYNLIMTLAEPVIFRNMIENWKARQWSIDVFCERFCNLSTTFKVCPRTSRQPNSPPIMETDCMYVQGRIGFFTKWLNGEDDPESPLNQLSRERFALYIDYKYMKDMFVNDDQEVLKDVDWGAFGCHGKDGSHSTIWIGSSHAFTPLHKDTYGCNLVAQLSGRKSWSLFHPDDTDKLYPVRLPYEESSIFSAVDIENPDFTKYPKFMDAKGYKVILCPGDVLFVPKHWWHFVRHVEAGISVNMWITKVDDDFDQVKEAVVRLLICSIKGFECPGDRQWLNPNEVN